MDNIWKCEMFSPKQISENMAKSTFTVPTYQRGIVWTDKQKHELIDTIKKGLPFGTLLLYKTDKGYQIIDGLQRSNAIKEFEDNPGQFFDEDDIDEEIIGKIVKQLGVKGNENKIFEELICIIKEWVKQLRTIEDVKNMQYLNCVKEIKKKFPTVSENAIEVGELLEPMLNKFREICMRISETQIPAIVFEGDRTYLPILFERINSKGIKLSKYQVYAASWEEPKFHIEDDLLDLVKYNRNRYDCMLEGKANLDDYDSFEFEKAKELNTFELCFGFGKNYVKNGLFYLGKMERLRMWKVLDLH